MKDGELILEILKSVQTGIADIKEELTRINRRMSTHEEHMNVAMRTLTHHEDDFDRLRSRVERIERRLDLHDPQH